VQGRACSKEKQESRKDLLGNNEDKINDDRPESNRGIQNPAYTSVLERYWKKKIKICPEKSDSRSIGV